MFHERGIDYFNCLYEESAKRPKIMAIACHPYLAGMPHRIHHVRHLFEEVVGREGVVVWGGVRIMDSYLKERCLG